MTVTFPTIDLVHSAYRSGATVDDVIAQVYARIRAADDPGIFITLIAEEAARAAARHLGAFDPVAKPLWGIPFAVKDNIDVAGLLTTAACPEFSYRADTTAFAVQRLIDAGAILIGKTNLDQFATGLVGVRTPYPVPRNAIDATYVPGGSSSGSAVAVAHGLVSFALGTDTAGSGRVPAGLNNVVGLKPSLGSVSTRGVVPACRTLDVISVFAGTVPDADVVFRTMAGYDPTDAYSRKSAVPAQPSSLPPGLRIGVPDSNGRKFGGDALSEAAFDATLDDLLHVIAGKAVTRLDISSLFEVARLLYSGPWLAERYQAIRSLIEHTPQALHTETRKIIGQATSISGADVFTGMYRLAELRREAEALWQTIDILVVPTYPRPRTVADLREDPFEPNNELGTYTNFVNLLDLSALAIPGRWRADRFPSGVTLIAPRGRDGLLAKLGAKLHAAANLTVGASNVPVPVAVDALPRAAHGELELAVVGAHLSGMPLNHELTERNARFLRVGATTQSYKLFALSGGPPRRPGLMRVAEGTGTAISVEVWALSPEALGDLLANVPSPLGIGTTCLADGTTPKGFIVEPEGLVGAADISHFGGWRNYMASPEHSGGTSALHRDASRAFAVPAFVATEVE